MRPTRAAPSTAQIRSADEPSAKATRSPSRAPAGEQRAGGAALALLGVGRVQHLDRGGGSSGSAPAQRRSAPVPPWRPWTWTRSGPDDVARARALLEQASRIVVLTGAGISTDSGIADFRGPQGVWTKNPEAEKMATLQAYMADPDLRRRSWQNRLTSPHVGRRAQRRPPGAGRPRAQRRLDTLVTQNIDGLHQKAGTDPARIVEIHGTARRSCACVRRPPAGRAGARAGARRRDDPTCLAEAPAASSAAGSSSRPPSASARAWWPRTSSGAEAAAAGATCCWPSARRSASSRRRAGAARRAATARCGHRQRGPDRDGRAGRRRRLRADRRVPAGAGRGLAGADLADRDGDRPTPRWP